MKNTIKMLTALMLVTILSMSLIASASAAPNTQMARNVAEADDYWTIYGEVGNYRRVYRVYSDVEIGPGSYDSEFTGQSPVSAAQAGLNMIKYATSLEYAKLDVDGKFGPATTSATKEFQNYVYDNDGVDVNANGWIGSKTWPYLASYSYAGYIW